MLQYVDWVAAFQIKNKHIALVTPGDHDLAKFAKHDVFWLCIPGSSCRKCSKSFGRTDVMEAVETKSFRVIYQKHVIFLVHARKSTIERNWHQ